jgi:hypothetical protein
LDLERVQLDVHLCGHSGLLASGGGWVGGRPWDRTKRGLWPGGLQPPASPLRGESVL